MAKKFFAGLLAVLMLALSGCSIGNTEVVLSEELSPKEVFRIGEETVTVAQMKVYLCNYQSLYGKSYGIDMWEQQFQTEDLQDYVKDVAMSQMTRIVCMRQLADQEQVTLTEEEKASVEAAAREYYDSLTAEELEYINASETEIQRLYEDYALANKVYETLVTSIDDEVSDDEARIMEVQQIFVTSRTTAAEVQSKLSAGADFETVAKSYNEAAEIDVTFGRGDMPAEVEEVAFSMEDGEVSPCISTEDGYYFIKCINKFNQELTDENKQIIIKKREEASFEEKYATLMETTDSYINESAWEDITLLTDGSITTDNFFDVYEKYFP
ncbi:MAG: peptidylprolyl isomerase [Roseburia sp.]